MTELEFHASGFVVCRDGDVDDRARARFHAYVRARGLAPNTMELERSIDDAVERYRSGDGLLVCGAAPCADVVCESDDTLAEMAARTRIPTTRTGCQGFCKHKPVIALRIAERREMLGCITTNDDRAAILEFARAAAAHRSTLVPESGRIEPFRFDPAHEHHEPRLRPVHFLLGRFRGEGRYADDSYTFAKEVVGAYEAGGRFMTLRMEARYPTGDRGLDIHRALVVVGTSRGGLIGRAFTDGGDIHDYAVECRGHRLEFDDQSPDHGTRWKRVRKLLAPTKDGYDERLEVDRGDGFEPYYCVAMRR